MFYPSYLIILAHLMLNLMKRFLSFFACVMLLALGACQPEPFLSVSTDSLSFTESGGSQSIQVTANYAWTASVSGSGFSVSPSSGEGNSTVTVTASAATSPDEASGTLTIRSEGLSASVSLSQSAKPTLVLGDGVKVPASGGSVEIPIQFNTGYTVEVESSARSWIRFIETRALSSGRLVFEVSANEGEERSGKVTVKDYSGKAPSVTVTITQEAETKVLVVGDVATVPAEGATVEVDVQYNVDYTVEIEPSAQSWIHYVETRTVQSGKLVFLVDANDGEERSGKVTVKDNSGKAPSVTVTITQEAETKVLVVGDVATVPAEGATVEVDVQYNVDYTVEVESSAQSWIHYVETKVVQSGKLVFLVDANEGEERSGKVTVKDSSGKVDPVTITFVQDRLVILEVGTMPEVPFQGGVYYISFICNTQYKIEVEESAKDWIHILGFNMEDETQLGVYVLENHWNERRGSFTVSDVYGKREPVVVEVVQEASPEPEIRRILLEIYNAMDGPNWKGIQGWNENTELYEWSGVHYNSFTGEVELAIDGFGLKGEIPECIGELNTLVQFFLRNEPGVTGTLPQSFGKLVNLKALFIEYTSMTSLPDIFSDMKKLTGAMIMFNDEMTGPIPESLGTNDDLTTLALIWNSFTGTPPPSWARHYKVLGLSANHLTGKIPDTYLTGERVGEKLADILMQQQGYGFDLSDVDIKGYWPDGYIEDVVTGQDFKFDDVVSKNKYTVFLSWAPWCPFSKALMPQLLDYYKQYRQDGLEIVSTVILNPDGSIWTSLDEQIETIEDKGYDGWYNYYFNAYPTRSYSASTPVAEVYDSKGNVLFSHYKYPGNDSRGRYGHPASTDLIPFLETLLGPAEVPDAYTSTDYSRDGEVLTLQKASVGRGINIVFIGDAYTDRDMGDGGLYETVMRQAMEEFFSIEPYKSFRQRFNVYAVKVVSENGRIGDGYSTSLGSAFGNGTEIGGLVDKCYEYALKVPGIDDRNNLLVNVIANTKRHSGTAYMSESTMSSVTFTSSFGNDPEFMGSVLRHEAGGHGFAFLADEYITHQGTVPQSQIDFWNDLYTQYGWYSNIDFTDDPSKIRWSAFLSDGRYKDEVGIYEGGGLYSLGAYRPSQNSMMNENFEYYNAPSRWAIYQRIMKLSGEEYSFEKFLEYDAVNRGKPKAVRPPLKAAMHVHTAPPVILP